MRTSTDEMDTQSYWEARLRSRPDLRGTGHRQFSVDYNAAMYKVATDRLRETLDGVRVSLDGARVLDVGAGLGYFVGQYLEWGAAHVTGIDITEISVRHLRQLFPQLEFIQADIASENLVLPPDYDLVSAISVLFHILDNRKFERALGNICASVRPGGHLLVVDAFWKPLLPTAKHTRLRSLKHYLPTLGRHAFRVLAVRPMYYFMGRSVVPFIGPRLLSWRPVLEIWLKLEYSLGPRLRSNWGGPKFLIAQRYPVAR